MALSSSKLTAAQYRELAEAFDQGGWTVEAALLRERAVLRRIARGIFEKRQGRPFSKRTGALWTPEAVEELAAAFEEEGATGSAKTLREHAIAIRHAKEVPLSSAKRITKRTSNEARISYDAGRSRHGVCVRYLRPWSQLRAPRVQQRSKREFATEEIPGPRTPIRPRHPSDASHPDPTIANP